MYVIAKMNKTLLTVLLAFLFIPWVVCASPVSVNRLNNDHIEPLVTSDYIKGDHMIASSTIATSTFAGGMMIATSSTVTVDPTIPQKSLVLSGGSRLYFDETLYGSGVHAYMRMAPTDDLEIHADGGSNINMFADILDLSGIGQVQGLHLDGPIYDQNGLPGTAGQCFTSQATYTLWGNCGTNYWTNTGINTALNLGSNAQAGSFQATNTAATSNFTNLNVSQSLNVSGQTSLDSGAIFTDGGGNIETLGNIMGDDTLFINGSSQLDGGSISTDGAGGITTTSLAGTGTRCLQATGGGQITAATTGCSTGGIAYPFGLTGNATSSLTQFNGGLTAYASSTIGNGINGLTINGTATSSKVVTTSTASSTFAGSVIIPSGSVTVPSLQISSIPGVGFANRSGQFCIVTPDGGGGPTLCLDGNGVYIRGSNQQATRLDTSVGNLNGSWGTQSAFGVGIAGADLSGDTQLDLRSNSHPNRTLSTWYPDGAQSRDIWQLLDTSGNINDIIDKYGSYGIGTTTGLGLFGSGLNGLSAKLAVQSNSNTVNIAQFSTSSNPTSIGLIINNNANAGIGTSTPDSKLDVNGTVRFEGASAFVTPSISGVIVGIGCDSADNTGLTGLSSTTAFSQPTPTVFPGAGLTFFTMALTSTSARTYVCSDVTVTPNASTYNVRIIR